MALIRVLRILNRFNLGGPTYNAAYLSKYLNDGFITKLAGGMQDKKEADSEFIVNSLDIIPVRISHMRRTLNPLMDFLAYQQIIQIIKNFEPHIVHTHASKAGILGRLAAHKLKVPVIVHTFHGHVFDAYFNKINSNVFIQLERYMARKTDAIITLSKNQEHDIVEKYRICQRNKSYIIPLGFELSKFRQDNENKRKIFRQKYKVSDDEIAIGIIGRLVPVKNHKLFIKAIEFLYKNSEKKIKAFIVGDGESRKEIKQLLIKKNIPYSDSNFNNATVILTSWQKDVDIICAGLDIVALTSLNEGTPVSLIEAQAAGKPIVSTNVGGVSNTVLENKTALLSNINDDNDFINKLKLLTENDNLRDSFSKDGWYFVSEKYNYQRMIDEMKQLYLSLLKKKKATYD